ncbi:MAG: carbohydrate ABC transporter permease [Fimbriimonadaceae bacterium]
MTQKGRGWFIAAFLGPATLVYGLFVIYPLFQAFEFSLYRWRGVSQYRTFLGLGNFTKLANDAAFIKALHNNLMLLIVGGVITIALAVALAHGLQGSGKVARTLRGIILFPQIISLVVVAVLWMFLFNPGFGLLTSGLKAIGLGGWVHTWLGEPKTALGSVGVAFVWYAVGFYAMLFAAGLRALPAEVQEAAELDGASGLKRFVNVTWPMLWSVKRIAIIHFTIAVMNVFALVYLMTRGGPDRATETLLTYLYESAFTNSEFGYATAIAVVNFVVVMALAGGIMLWLRRDPQEARA